MSAMLERAVAVALAALTGSGCLATQTDVSALEERVGRLEAQPTGRTAQPQRHAERSRESREIVPDPEARLSVEIYAVRLAKIVRYISQRSGALIRIRAADYSGGLERLLENARVGWHICHEMPWQELLRRVAVAAHFTCTKDGEVWVLEPQRTFTLEPGTRDLREVMDAIAAGCGVSIQVGDDVPEDMTVTQDGRSSTTWAYYHIVYTVRKAGLRALRDDITGAWSVHTRETVESRLETRELPLRYLRPFFASKGWKNGRNLGWKPHVPYRRDIVVDGKPLESFSWGRYSRPAGSQGDLLDRIRNTFAAYTDGDTSFGEVHVETEPSRLWVRALPSAFPKIQALLDRYDRRPQSVGD